MIGIQWVFVLLKKVHWITAENKLYGKLKFMILAFCSAK